MGRAAQTPIFSAADYLAWEGEQTERHEYMAFALRQHLSGSACRTYMSGMRLHVAAAKSYFYPDVLVTCSALDVASAMVKTEPKLIAEVLSPTTAAYDRGLKFGHYRTLPSLEEYLMVDLDTRATDCYRKGADGLWVLHPFGRGEAIQLASVALTLTAAQLFAEVPDN